MKFNNQVEVDINNESFLIRKATPGVTKQIEDADAMREEWQAKNKRSDYRQDQEFRGKFWKQLAEACLEKKKGDMPDQEFYESEEFEYGTLLNVADFLSSGGRTMLMSLYGSGTVS